MRQLPVLRMHHEEHVGEARPKVGPISVVVSSQFKITHFHKNQKMVLVRLYSSFVSEDPPGGLGGVDVHALWAVELHHRLSRDIRQPNWHHWLYSSSCKPVKLKS